MYARHNVKTTNTNLDDFRVKFATQGTAIVFFM